MQWAEPAGKLLVVESRRGAGSATDRHSVIPHKRMSRTFSIDGENKPARAVFTWPVMPRWSSEPHLDLRLEYDGLTASWPVDDREAGLRFAEFFAELARSREGALDLVARSLHSDLTISASQHWHGHQRQVTLVFKVSCDTQDPYWTAELRMDVEKDRLAKLAADAAAFFDGVGA